MHMETCPDCGMQVSGEDMEMHKKKMHMPGDNEMTDDHHMESMSHENDNMSDDDDMDND